MKRNVWENSIVYRKCNPPSASTQETFKPILLFLEGFSKGRVRSMMEQEDLSFIHCFKATASLSNVSLCVHERRCV